MNLKRSCGVSFVCIGLVIALFLSGTVVFAGRAEATNSLGIQRVVVDAISPSEFNFTVVYGPDANYWHRFKGGVRKITPSGAVTTFANANVNAGRLTVGSDGNLWFANGTSIGRFSMSGYFSFFSGPGISSPGDLVLGPDQNLWFANYVNYGSASVGKISPAGTTTIYTDPAITYPQGLVAGPDGNIWFGEGGAGSHKIIRLTTVGVVTVFTDPLIQQGHLLTVGPDGNIWAKNVENANIVKITPGGTVLAAYPMPGFPSGLISFGGKIWFGSETGAPGTTLGYGTITTDGVVEMHSSADYPSGLILSRGPSGYLLAQRSSSASPSIGLVSSAGAFTVTPVTASPSPIRAFGSGSDSPIVSGADGNMWLAAGTLITRVTPAGVATTLDPGVNALIVSLAAGTDGNIWFATQSKSGKITPSGVVTVFDTGGFSIAQGSDGNMWMSQPSFGGSGSIHQITPTGTVTTFPLGFPWCSGNALGPDGNQWLTCGFGTNKLLRVETDGTVTAFTDSSINNPGTVIVGSDDRVWFPNQAGNSVTAVAMDGTFTTYNGIISPGLLTQGPDDMIWLRSGASANYPSPSTQVITRITTSGQLKSPNYSSLHFDDFVGMTLGADGNIWALTASSVQTIGTDLAPSPPRSVRATAGNGAAVVAWDAPESSGGSLGISSYLVTSNPGGKTCSFSNYYGSPTCEVSDLTNGVAYTFSVVARASNFGSSAVVDSAASEPSAPVTPSSSSFRSVSPLRVFDTRPGPDGLRSVSKSKVGGGYELRVKVTDLPGVVPALGVGAVSLNVTVTQAEGPGFVTVYPCGSRPNASSLNYVTGQTVPNAVIAAVSDQGEVCFYSKAPVHLLADVNGWFAAS